MKLNKYSTNIAKSLINLLAHKINMISQREIFVNHSQGTVINGTYWSLKWGAFFSFFEFAISINLDLDVLRVSSFSFSQQATFFRSIFSLCCKSSNQEEEYRTALCHKQIRQHADAYSKDLWTTPNSFMCSVNSRHFNLLAVRLFYWFAFSSHDFISIQWAVCSFRLIRPFRGFWLRRFFCAVLLGFHFICCLGL